MLSVFFISHQKNPYETARIQWKVINLVLFVTHTLDIQNPPNTWWVGVKGTLESRASGGICGFKRRSSQSIWKTRDSKEIPDAQCMAYLLTFG